MSASNQVRGPGYRDYVAAQLQPQDNSNDLWQKSPSGVPAPLPEDGDNAGVLAPLSDDGGNAGGFNAAPMGDEGQMGGGGDGACRNCGLEGHFARDCPEPKKMGACFKCGEEGHNKAECPNPRIFKGTCRICDEEGHPAAQCPSKPPDVCRNCDEEGHIAKDCTNNRKLDRSDVEDKAPDDAWAAMKKADDERDMDDFKEAMDQYVKALPGTTYSEIETGLREQNFKFHLIALEKPLLDVLTNMNLQGKLDCKYSISIQLSAEPHRKKEAGFWPKSPEENLERLKDAGVPVDRKVMKCIRCGELGHTSKGCQMEREESKAVTEEKCAVCSESGHRARDCRKPRVDRFACRNCKQRGHNAKECPEPKDARTVLCKVCEKMGHFARDCTEKPVETCRNCGQEGHRARECTEERVITCRNCDEVGHMSKECTKKKDWSRVQCKNCGEKGHGLKRCPEPLKEKFQDAASQSGGFVAGHAGRGFDAPAGGDDYSSVAPLTSGGDAW